MFFNSVLLSVFCSFKDLCEGRSRDTLRSRMDSPVASLDQTLRESVWTALVLDMVPAVITYRSLILCKAPQLWACRERITWCPMESDLIFSTWHWKKWKKSQLKPSLVASRMQRWFLTLKMKVVVRLTRSFRIFLMSWQSLCRHWMT